MAGTNDLNVALVVKATTDQARAQLAQVKAELQGINEASTQASAASASEAASVADVSAAQAARAETEAEAIARIHDMIQASKQASLAEQARAVAARSTATAVTESTAAEVAASRDLAAAQTASMEAGTRAFLAREAGLNILAKSKLTTTDVARAEQLLGQAVAGGAMSQRLMLDALAAVDASKVKDAIVQDVATKATEANTKANIVNAESQKLVGGAMNSRARREFGTIGAEALSGNFGRVRTSGLALANDMGLFTKLLTPTGLAVGGLAVVLGTLAVAFAQGQEETDKFNRSIIGTGQAATTTGAQLVDTANAVGASTGRYGDAADALQQLAASGKYTSNQYEALTQTAVEFATMTGGKVADGVKFVDGVMSGNIGTLTKLDEQYHFLTASQLEEIKQLQSQGAEEQATAIAQRAASQAVHDRAQEVQDNAGIMVRAWDGVKSAASAAWAAMKDVGAAHSIGKQLQDAMADLKAAQGTHLDRAGNAVQNAQPGEIAALQSQITTLRAQLVAQGFAQTQAAVDQNAETKAKQGLSYLDKFQAPLTQFKDATAKAKAELDKAMLGHLTDAEIANAKAEYQAALDAAQKAFDSATKQHTARGHHGPNLGALQTNSAVAQAQQQMRQVDQILANGQKVIDAQHKAALVNDQAYFDAERGMLQVWENDKVAALEKEKAAAQSHVVTQADRIRADQKVAELDGEITQVHADAAAKRLQIDADEKKAVEETAKAWLDLRASLGLPVDVDTAKAVKKLQELYALLQKLKDAGKSPDPAQVDDMVGAALMTGVDTKQPRMRSAQLLPGANSRANPLAMVAADQQSEQKWYQAQQSQLAANYKAAQAAYAGNNAKLLQLQQQYQQKSDALAQDDAQRQKALAQAKYWAVLDTAQTALGQLAELSQSHNRKIAMVGKAAAIADAVINTYKNAVTAYGEGLTAGGPYAGPALGAVYAAIAVAAGLANVAAIRSQPVGQGYADGGWTGNAPTTQVVGVVHGREGVLSAPEVQSIGGEAGFNRLRAALRGYADGGYVSPLAFAPSPADLGFTAPALPRVDFRNLAAANDGARGAAANNVKVVLVQNSDQLAAELLNTPTGIRTVVQHVGNNGRKIQGKWGAG